MTVDEVVAIFNEVLETDGATADSDFFEMGGDSLIGTRVLSAIARSTGIELDFGDLVDTSTPSALAGAVTRVASAGATA